jgi:hypothetical protein
LDQTIAEGNKVTILTALPRSLAVKALKKAGLSPILEGRIDPDNLVFPLNLPEFINPPPVVAAAAAEAAKSQTASKISSKDFGVGEDADRHLGNTAHHNADVARTYWEGKMKHNDGVAADVLKGGLRYEGAILIRSK